MSDNIMLSASTLTDEEAAAIAGGVVGGAIVATIVFSIIWYVLQVVAWWKIFNKMGEPGWKSIIPFYNAYVQGTHTWTGIMNMLSYLLLFVGYIFYYSGMPQGYDMYSTADVEPASAPLVAIGGIILLVGVVLYIIGQIKLARSFDKGVGFIIGLIILEPIFMLILGFGSSKYIGNKHLEKQG